MDTLLRGIAIGFAIAAPVGPIGLLCIHRTLRSGFCIGFMSGAGAALADAAYALLAAFALSAVTSFFTHIDRPLHIAGGIALVAMGIRTIGSSHAPIRAPEVARVSLASAFTTTFALTMANPATIVSFVAVVSGSTTAFAPSSGLPLVSGVFAGSLLWWAVLSTSVALARRKLDERLRRVLDVLSGSVLAVFGIIMLAR